MSIENLCKFFGETYRRKCNNNYLNKRKMERTCINFSTGKDLNFSNSYSRNRLSCSSFVFKFALLLIAIIVVNSTEGKLTLSKQCGEIVCKAHYYCARVDGSCRPCQETCDKALSNYDQDLCEKDCQDYLHDLFYMRKALENHTELAIDQERIKLDYDDIQGELRTLKILLMITIVMSTAVMIGLFFLFWYLKRGRNRLGISNPNWCGGKDEIDLPVIYSNTKCFNLPLNQTAGGTGSVPNNLNNNSSRVSTPDVVARSEGGGCGTPGSVLAVNKLPYVDTSSLSQKAKQQKFRREPSESTLPEYLGYDNPAMTPSPTHM